MANGSYQLRKRLKRKIDKAGEFWLDKVPADMGNHSGVVVVPDKESMVYVRLTNGQVMEVFNDKAPNIYNWKVYIGRDKSQPALFKVMESRWVYNLAQTVAYVLFHHAQHEYPAPDTVWVQRDQFMPLLVLPAGTFNVRLFGDMIYRPGMDTGVRVADQDIDLSSHALDTGAKYELMEISPEGTVNYVIGDTWTNREELYTKPYPNPTEGSFPLVVLIFYEGQTELRRDSNERTIIDLRMFTSEATPTVGTQISDAEESYHLEDNDYLGYFESYGGELKKITVANAKNNFHAYVNEIYAVLRMRLAGLPINPTVETGITNGQVLTWDSTNSRFTNSDMSGGTSEPSLYVYMSDTFSM